MQDSDLEVDTMRKVRVTSVKSGPSLAELLHSITGPWGQTSVWQATHSAYTHCPLPNVSEGHMLLLLILFSSYEGM